MDKEKLYFLLSGLVLGLVTGIVITYQIMQSRPVPIEASEISAANRQNVNEPDIDDIIEMHLKVVEKDPQNTKLMKSLGNLYQDKGDWIKAIEWYKKVLQREPFNQDVLTDTGTCYWRLGDEDEALRLFAKSIEIDPDHWQSHFNRAVVEFVSKKDATRALESIREVERLNPGYEPASRLKKEIEERIKEDNEK